MRIHQWTSVRMGRLIVSALALAVSGVLFGLVREVGLSPLAAQAPAHMESTILAFDGQDFVRTQTTLVTEGGKSAVNTKLEHDTPAYKALIQKHSYTGDVTLFGREYRGSYAPLTAEDGRLTGALFVAVAK